MKFLSVSINNFMSIKYCTVDFTAHRLALVIGVNRDAQISTSNGAGKTCIFDAVPWLLFGHTSRSVSKDSVVNDKAGSDCHVSLIFESAGNSYQVTRYRMDTKWGNSLHITCNNRNLTGSTAKKSQVILDKILPFDERIFFNIIYFPAGMRNSYMHVSDQDKKLLLESLLDVSAYEECITVAKSKVVLIKSSIASIENEITYKSKLLTAKEIEYKDILLSSDMEAHRDKLSGLMDLRLAAMLNNKDNKLAMAPLVLEQEHNTNIKRTLSMFDNSLRRTSLIVDRYIANNTKQCCTGLEHGAAGHSHEGKSPVSKMHDIRRSITGSREDLLPIMQGIMVKGDTIKSKIYNLSSDIESTKKDFMNITANISALDSHIKSYSTICDRLRKEFENLNKDFNDTSKRLKVAKSEGVYLDYVKSVFTKLRSTILTDAINDLNSLIKVYIDKIFSEDITVRILPTKSAESDGVPRISISISYSRGAPRDYYTFSEGERRRIDLALHLSLVDLSRRYSNNMSNILLMDEATEAIDQSGTIAVISSIKERFRDRNVFMISHQGYLAAEIDDHITVVKENGVSTLL